MAESKIITSAQNEAVKRLKSLAQKKYRDAEGVFLVEGLRHINDALNGGFTLDTIAFSPRGAEGARPLQLRAKTALETTDDILSRITGRDNTQSAVAALNMRWAAPEKIATGLWVALEGVRDPGNLGTIIRTADAVKAEGVILLGETCDPWSPEAVRGSMGSFARVAIARMIAAEFIDFKKTYQGRVIGTHLATDADFRAADYTAPLVLVMGSESNGLSDDMAKACDQLVKIPMAGGAESLNLAVSTGVMLYEALRQRK